MWECAPSMVNRFGFHFKSDSRSARKFFLIWSFDHCCEVCIYENLCKIVLLSCAMHRLSALRGLSLVWWLGRGGFQKV